MALRIRMGEIWGVRAAALEKGDSSWWARPLFNDFYQAYFLAEF